MFDKLIHKYLKIPYRLHVGLNDKVKNEHATIIFLHGIAASSRAWKKLTRELRHTENFRQTRLICIDLLGFGKSPAPEWTDYSIDDHIKSLHRTIKKLHIKTPIYFVGHSMGGILATEYATRHRDRVQSLLLVSPPFINQLDHKSWSEEIYTKFLKYIEKMSSSKHVAVVARVISAFSTFESRSVKRKSFNGSLANVIINGDSWTTLTTTDIPTTIIHGRFDTLVYHGDLVKLSKKDHITLVEVLSGHDIFGRKQTEIVKQLKNLITEPRS